MDMHALRRVFGLFATGVTVVTTRNADQQPVAITVNSFTSVSMDPPLVLWCLDNRSRHLLAFALNERFAVHVLKRDQAELALQCARSEAPPVDLRSVSSSTPVIEGAIARIECRVANFEVAGDHTIVIGEVEGVGTEEGSPLVFHASQFGGFAPSPKTNGEEAWNILTDMWS